MYVIFIYYNSSVAMPKLKKQDSEVHNEHNIIITRQSNLLSP